MNNNKVDKGFKILYGKLSNRRKFIRTLWITPFIIMLSIYMFYTGDILFPIFLISAFFIQLIYTYFKWKAEEQV